MKYEPKMFIYFIFKTLSVYIKQIKPKKLNGYQLTLILARSSFPFFMNSAISALDFKASSARKQKKSMG